MTHLPALRLLFALTTAALVLPVVGTETASAQTTGGSFGGGGFGGGGGGGGGGSSTWSSGGSYGGVSYSGSGEDDFGGLCCGFILLVLAWGLVVVVGKLSEDSSGGPSPTSQRWQGMDVTMVQIAIDHRARAQVQGELDRMAKSGQTGSAAGLAKLCREAALAIRGTELAWLYARAKNYKPMSPPMAEGEFRSLATDARTRFRHEVVRSADGTLTTQDGPDVRAKSEEGQGVVVVSLVVAARYDLFDLTDASDARQIAQALDNLATIDSGQLVALEVIWSPAKEDDRMSTAELEVLYPELRLLDETTVAGRIFCGHCSAPFAAELPSCPQCGAPHRA